MSRDTRIAAAADMVDELVALSGVTNRPVAEVLGGVLVDVLATFFDEEHGSGFANGRLFAQIEQKVEACVRQRIAAQEAGPAGDADPRALLAVPPRITH